MIGLIFNIIEVSDGNVQLYERFSTWKRRDANINYHLFGNVFNRIYPLTSVIMLFLLFETDFIPHQERRYYTHLTTYRKWLMYIPLQVVFLKFYITDVFFWSNRLISLFSLNYCRKFLYPNLNYLVMIVFCQISINFAMVSQPKYQMCSHCSLLF